jgi:cytochrome c oxidase subunit 1
LAVGYLLPLGYFIWSLRYGKAAPMNPYLASGLEWQTGSPPPPENFQGPVVVVEEPYRYDKMISQAGTPIVANTATGRNY